MFSSLVFSLARLLSIIDRLRIRYIYPSCGGVDSISVVTIPFFLVCLLGIHCCSILEQPPTYIPYSLGLAPEAHPPASILKRPTAARTGYTHTLHLLREKKREIKRNSHLYCFPKSYRWRALDNLLQFSRIRCYILSLLPPSSFPQFRTYTHTQIHTKTNTSDNVASNSFRVGFGSVCCHGWPCEKTSKS